MAQQLLPLVETAIPRRRGRPPGARNRGSMQLAKYVEATFGGMTPGQQAAEIAMVKPADLKRARGLAQQLGIPAHEGMSPLMLAMVVKARQLASAIGCETRDAWLLLAKEREGLLPYIHQRQAPMAEGKGKPVATAFLIPEGETHQPLADFSEDDDAPLEIVGDLEDQAQQVGQPKSDEDT